MEPRISFRRNSKHQDVYDAIRSDDWGKLIGFLETSPMMTQILIDYGKKDPTLFSKEPLLNILIAYEKFDLLFEVVEELEPEDLEAKNFNGDTALHIAAAMGKMKVAGALLDSNIKLISLINMDGESPLLKAALNGQRDMFWKLYYRGGQAQIKARRSDGATALHCAIMANHFELANEIIGISSDLILARDELGLTVLHHMVSIPDAFRSGCQLTPIDARIYELILVEDSSDQQFTHKEADELDEHYSQSLMDPTSEWPSPSDNESDDNVVESSPFETTLPNQSTVKHGDGMSPELRDRRCGGKILAGHRSSTVANKKSYTNPVKWVQQLLSKFKTADETKLIPKRRKVNEGDEEDPHHPYHDDDDDDEEDEDFGRHHHPALERKKSKSFKLLELRDEEVQSNALMKFLDPLAKHKSHLVDLKTKHKHAIILLSNIAKSREYWLSLSRGSIPQNRLAAERKCDKMMERWMETPLTLGASMGLDELVIRILKTHPPAATYLGKEGKNLLHVAVQYRRDKIVKVLDWIGNIDPRLPFRMKSAKDDNGNTILHLAAMPNNGTSSPMQMLEEFKWFERVMAIVPKDLVNHRNKDGKTAQELFTESHVSMVEEAKKQLTNTAQSCCAALVSAVMFAAGFSIANGNKDEEKGKVKSHSSKIAKKIFSHTYVFGLSCTAMALVQFMALLMASYKQEDFRRSLPTQYVLALASLFTSMVAMLIAFGCNTYISLYDDLKLDWRNYLPVTAEIFLFPLICLVVLRWRGVQFPFLSSFRAFLR